MADGSVSLEKWRDYFRSASSDIFIIIEHAILVAASDCPYDFRLRRDRIAEMLFTCKVIKCFGCDKVELAVPNGDGLDKSEDKLKSEIDAGGSKDTKESKVNSSCRNYDDDHQEVMEMNTNHVANYSDGDAEAEALTDEIEEESQFYGEVLRIKDVVDNFEEESDALLFDCLRKLQLMPLSVEILKATEIGKSVNAIRKHGSKEIRNLVRTLIMDWKVMVDSWVNATAAVAEMATESVKTSAVEEEEEEEGLPSPPLDEGAFFATPSSMELSQFFDGMDDDGNPRNSGEFNKNRESGRKPTIPKTDSRNWRAQNPHDSRAPPIDRKPEPKRNEEATWTKQSPLKLKPHRPSSDESGPGRPKPPSMESAPGRFKPSLKPKIEYATVKVEQKSENRPIQRKPMPPQQEKLNSKNEASVRMKLEAAKRKLQERYQEAENAKKQRTIQVVELQDLPKQSHAQRNPHMRPGNHNRQWANGRR
ncbi:probable mediator of RNA polymerase II transcription subunit 26b [Salvia miltiorrhiza]|uniref:probable mediator of RNA polymerase II transcription subunit 26b n=1 Tax=Salvia miltiorrhiza TaxID=226208 RepID=UPI0025AB6BC3|nr:probable mediator of RNA polymerase II transcription subunit 26b [Salvia miltiorrhiza]